MDSCGRLWPTADHETKHKTKHTTCPFCGYRQPFELARLRDETFPIEGLHGTYAGLSWDNDENAKVNGRWNFDHVTRTAHYRCYQCDARIETSVSSRSATGERRSGSAGSA